MPNTYSDLNLTRVSADPDSDMANHPHYLWRDMFRKRKGRSTVEEVLRENILFRTLSDRELRYLSTLVYERTYEAEEQIFHQGDRGVGVYLVVSGRVSVKTQSSGVGNDVLVTHLEPGSFFGELALIEPDTLRTASVMAAERTVVIGFFKPDLLEVLEHKPDMGVKILFQLSSVLGQRLLESTEKITFLTRVRGISEAFNDAV